MDADILDVVTMIQRRITLLASLRRDQKILPAGLGELNDWKEYYAAFVVSSSCPEFEKWHREKEEMLFKLRCQRSTGEQMRQLIDFLIGSRDETRLVKTIEDAGSDFPADLWDEMDMKKDPRLVYRVPFTSAFRAVGKRRVVLWRGYAFINGCPGSNFDILNALCESYSAQHVRRVAYMRQKFPSENNESMDGKTVYCNSQVYYLWKWEGLETFWIKAAAIQEFGHLPLMIADIPAKSFPPCIALLLEKCQKSHLKNDDRKTLFIFLMAIGVVPADATRLLEDDYVRNGMPAKKAKIDLNGLMGTKKYTPVSCTTSGRCGQCPYFSAANPRMQCRKALNLRTRGTSPDPVESSLAFFNEIKKLSW